MGLSTLKSSMLITSKVQFYYLFICVQEKGVIIALCADETKSKFTLVPVNDLFFDGTPL
jgi:hypothetical protein